MPPLSPPDEDHIWVQSDLLDDGHAYGITVRSGPTIRVTLTPDTALAYVLAVCAAAEYAAMEAAIYRQLRASGCPTSGIALTVMEHRNRRRPLDGAATAPLCFRPGVDVDGKPYVAVSGPDGWWFGQLHPAVVRDHALGVLRCLVHVHLQETYLEVLRAELGLGEDSARDAVRDVQHLLGGTGG